MAAVGKRQKLREFRSLRSADLNAWCGMDVMTMLAVNGRFSLRDTSSSHLQRKSGIRPGCQTVTNGPNRTFLHCVVNDH